MLEDSGARALVTRAGEVRASEGIHRIDLEDLAEIQPAIPAGLPRVDPAQLFAVIYTSGSTGRPKGVAVEHRSVAAFLAGAASLFPPEQREGVLAAASICFDLSVLELFLPLAHGGTAVLAENALDLPRLPARDAVRLAFLVPSATAELLRGGGIPPSVRTVVQGGEALPAGLAQALLEERPQRRLVNAYGPTEATIYSLAGEVRADPVAAPPLGRAAPPPPKRPPPGTAARTSRARTLSRPSRSARSANIRSRQRVVSSTRPQVDESEPLRPW
jgi:non-ribosomal peptide synthetase component F